MVTRRNIKFQLSGGWAMFSGAIQYSNTATVAIVNTSDSDNLLQFQSCFHHPYSTVFLPPVSSSSPFTSCERESPMLSPFWNQHTHWPAVPTVLTFLTWLCLRRLFLNHQFSLHGNCMHPCGPQGKQARLTRIHSCSSPTWNQFLSRKDFYSSSFREQLAVRGKTEQEKQFWRHVQPRHYRIIHNR